MANSPSSSCARFAPRRALFSGVGACGDAAHLGENHPTSQHVNTCAKPLEERMLAFAMRRFSLRLKSPDSPVCWWCSPPAWWRCSPSFYRGGEAGPAERIASALVNRAPWASTCARTGRTSIPAACGTWWTSSRIEGVQIVYALLWTNKGHLDPDASSVNASCCSAFRTAGPALLAGRSQPHEGIGDPRAGQECSLGSGGCRSGSPPTSSTSASAGSTWAFPPRPSTPN